MYILCSECQRNGAEYRVNWQRKNDLTVSIFGSSNACSGCASDIVVGPNTIVVHMYAIDSETDYVYLAPRQVA